MIFNTLCDKLNPRKGNIQQNTSNGESSISFDIRWKGDIHFVVRSNGNHGWYYVQRNQQAISALYYFPKLDVNVYNSMQNLVNDIDSGKYNNKKTLKEKLRETIEHRNLTSYMNNTKWKELITALEKEIEDVPIKYKTLFEDDITSYEFWTISGDEQIQYMNKAIIEWFKISCEIKEIRKVGRLIPDKVTIIDKKTEIEAILKNIILIMSMMIKKNVLLYGNINKPGFVKNNS